MITNGWGLPVTGIRRRRCVRQWRPYHLAVVRFDQPDSRGPDFAGYFGDADEVWPAGQVHNAADDIRPVHVVVGGADQVERILRH